jgi:hypothetical protein
MNTHFPLCNRRAIVIGGSVVELATRDDDVGLTQLQNNTALYSEIILSLPLAYV